MAKLLFEKTGRIGRITLNQLAMQKMVINQAMGLAVTQRVATLLDGVARHSPEGLAFAKRAEAVGWKQAVKERDAGTYDRTAGQPFAAPEERGE